jgi:hypothetical protein
MAAKPNAKRFVQTKEQAAQTAPVTLPAPFRLRLELANVECDLDQALLLTTIRTGNRMVMAPRWDVDSRLPADAQVPYTPTPKQLLYAARADIANISVERDPAGHAYSVETTGQTTEKAGWFKRAITLGHATKKVAAKVRLSVHVTADGAGSKVTVEGASDDASRDAARSLLAALRQRLS